MLLTHKHNNMKNLIQLKELFVTALFCCVAFGNTACVNQIEDDSEEIEVGTTPITFSVKIEKTMTRVSSTAFEKGDKVGLLATVASNSIQKKRYIDNLQLEYTGNSTLVPKKAVFYPEGDVALDFVCYYPYQSDGILAGTSTLPVSVRADQSDAANRSQSDFLVAKATGITSKTGTVALEFEHKLSKLTIALVPDTDSSAEDLKKANPRITATGLKTSAVYNLEDGTFTNLKGDRDIVASGEWRVEDGNLTGKEILIIPQTINDSEQSFVMEWNDRIYNCVIPKTEMSSSTQCEVKISTMQTNSNTLTGIVGKIKEWNSVESLETDNMDDYATVHVSALSFSKSNVYRIYHEGTPVAEVCKEYLKSEALTSRAIVAYPVGEGEKTDLEHGIVLQFMDREDVLCGGTLRWNADDYEFTYTEGKSQAVDKFYVDESYNLSLVKPEKALTLNVLCYALQDVRNGISNEYPIVKVGRQYWMGEDLRATSYRNGKTLTKLIDLGTGPGYFKPDKKEVYFYNGEAVIAGEMAPDGWRISTEEDWDELRSYLHDDASLLKVGEWKDLKGNASQQPVNNLTHMSVIPVGMWFNKMQANEYRFVAYWRWDKKNDTLSDQALFFNGEENGFVSSPSRVTDKTYYKGLCIRCVKE